MTNGTTAHLLDFTAASANQFGRQSSTAKRVSTAGSLMDDDMQVGSSDARAQQDGRGHGDPKPQTLDCIIVCVT